MGKKLIIANWKMNFTIGEASLFVHKLDVLVDPDPDVEVVLAPPMVAIQPLHLQTQHHHFQLAAQNFYWRDSGPYTGEVSATQLTGLVKYAIVGHSERRNMFGELNRDIRSKIQSAYRNRLIPILCVGETATERAEGETNDVLHDQLVGGLANITSEEASNLIISYEPVWAIGTGKDAAPGDVVKAARAIRSQVSHLFGSPIGKKLKILYGGSVTVDNAVGFLEADGIDGLLIGTASLDVRGFAEIINKAQKMKKSVAKKK